MAYHSVKFVAIPVAQLGGLALLESCCHESPEPAEDSHRCDEVCGVHLGPPQQPHCQPAGEGQADPWVTTFSVLGQQHSTQTVRNRCTKDQ